MSSRRGKGESSQRREIYENRERNANSHPRGSTTIFLHLETGLTRCQIQFSDKFKEKTPIHIKDLFTLQYTLLPRLQELYQKHDFIFKFETEVDSIVNPKDLEKDQITFFDILSYIAYNRMALVGNHTDENGRDSIFFLKCEMDQPVDQLSCIFVPLKLFKQQFNWDFQVKRKHRKGYELAIQDQKNLEKIVPEYYHDSIDNIDTADKYIYFLLSKFEKLPIFKELKGKTFTIMTPDLDSNVVILQDKLLFVKYLVERMGGKIHVDPTKAPDFVFIHNGLTSQLYTLDPLLDEWKKSLNTRFFTFGDYLDRDKDCSTSVEIFPWIDKPGTITIEDSCFKLDKGKFLDNLLKLLEKKSSRLETSINYHSFANWEIHISEKSSIRLTNKFLKEPNNLLNYSMFKPFYFDEPLYSKILKRFCPIIQNIIDNLESEFLITNLERNETYLTHAQTLYHFDQRFFINFKSKDDPLPSDIYTKSTGVQYYQVGSSEEAMEILNNLLP
jgi:hypothetical protein